MAMTAESWRAANPEKYDAAKRRYWEKLKADPVRYAKRLARQRIYDANSTPERKAKKALQRKLHPEAMRRAMIAHRRRNPAYYLWNAARDRCRQSGVEFAISREWAEAQWTGKCELSGLPFVLHERRPGPYSPSLDRIDASQGYVEGNCRFILWALNRFKNSDSDADMIVIARALIASADG